MRRCDKKMKKTRLAFCVVIILSLFVCSSCYAAWWGTPGYEWALSRGLTSMKTQSTLNKEVTTSDYYNIILRYLKLKNVEPKNKVVQTIHIDDVYNGVINGLIKDVNSYIGPNQVSLEPQEYRVVESLVEHGKKLAADQKDVLTRDDLKNLNLYLDLAKYRAAMLIETDTRVKRDYRSSVLYSLRNTKYSDSLSYGILPIHGGVSRGSFLTLMYNLLSDNTSNSDQIIKSFNEAGVLIGYDNSLWLDENIKYSEMLTFLYRFEAYDFNPVVDDTEEAE